MSIFGSIHYLRGGLFYLHSAVTSLTGMDIAAMSVVSRVAPVAMIFAEIPLCVLLKVFQEHFSNDCVYSCWSRLASCLSLVELQSF